MYTEGGKLVAEVVLPDFKKDEIEVTVTKESLEIKAEHKEKEETINKDRRYLLRESNQSYWRRLSLPARAKTDEVKCTLKDGKLIVSMPLEGKAKKKTIPIE
jgi:HSP20 family protein